MRSVKIGLAALAATALLAGCASDALNRNRPDEFAGRAQRAAGRAHPISR
jgi:hypothetical protein